MRTREPDLLEVLLGGPIHQQGRFVREEGGGGRIECFN